MNVVVVRHPQRGCLVVRVRHIVVVWYFFLGVWFVELGVRFSGW